MERTDSHKHDCIHKSRKHMLGNDEQEESSRGASRGEDGHDKLRKPGRNQTPDKRPTPDVHGGIALAPLSNVVAQKHLDRKVYQDDERQLLLLQALVQQLQAGDSVVCLEANLCNQVNDDEALNVLQLENTPHGAVHFSNTVTVSVAILALHDSQPKGNNQVGPAPEAKIAIQLHDACFGGGGTEPLICKVFGVEG